jgi:DNA-binding response OmpR family regulator
MKLLMIEDDRSITEIVALAFDMRWPEVELVTATLGEKGLALAKTEAPDAIILDLGLPDISGFDVLKEIRQFSTVPIVILTVRAEEKDVIKGVEMGADDYVVKPFRQMELLGRVEALVSRPRRRKKEEPLVHGPLYLDPSSRRFTVDGDEVTITATEADILYQLMKEPGSVVANSELVEAIWGQDYPNAADCLKTHIRRLREKVEPDPDHPQLVLGKSGKGHFLAK